MLYVTFKGESTTLRVETSFDPPPLGKGGIRGGTSDTRVQAPYPTTLYPTLQSEPYELYPKAVINLTFDAIKHNSMVYKKG